MLYHLTITVPALKPTIQGASKIFSSLPLDDYHTVDPNNQPIKH